jgi:hypothetical protein
MQSVFFCSFPVLLKLTQKCVKAPEMRESPFLFPDSLLSKKMKKKDICGHLRWRTPRCAGAAM